MAIIRLQPNKQITIALKHATPKEVNGKVGLEYQYTLANGSDVMYLPALAHAEIQALRPEPGESFILGNRAGLGNELSYFTERIEQPARKPPARSITLHLDAAVAIPPSLTTPESQRLFAQLVATIQAIKAAEEFAKSIDRPVLFGPEDIRAMAISGFIDEQRNGRRAA